MRKTAMRALDFWKTVVRDGSDLLEELIPLLQENGVRYCVVGGQGVNAYVDPVVSLDLDLAIVAQEIPRVESLLEGRFRLERFAQSLNVSQPGFRSSRSDPDRSPLRRVRGTRRTT
jgi:hypothetical protein